jgi:hypothetical protein
MRFAYHAHIPLVLFFLLLVAAMALFARKDEQ